MLQRLPACPLHTPRRRIYIAEICTLLRLRLLLAAGGLADRVEARALCTLACISRVVSLLALPSTCTSESFAQAKGTRGKKKKGPRMELRESPGFGIPSPAARSCHPTCARRLHFTTLQPITALSAAMHKVAIHPSNRVRQSCASRA